MSDKKRTSITLDKDVFQYLKQSKLNQSGLINDLVKEYRDGQDQQTAALELRYEHMIDEAEQLEERANEKRRKAEEIKKLLDEAKQTQREELQEAVEGVRNIRKHKRSPNNKAVEKWADHAGMDAEELLQHV
jgi:acetyl-CoA carboxylase alpha subunit